MNTDFLEEIDRKIRDTQIRGCALTNLGLNLRSCGCRLLTLHFEGLVPENWEARADDIIKAVEEEEFAWDVIYLNFFPGANIINRVTFRKFCDHCDENFQLDGTLGLGAKIFRQLEK